MLRLIKKNKYWLYIEQYVHVTKCENIYLFYNTLDGTSIEINAIGKLRNILNQLNVNNGLRITNFDDKLLYDKQIRQFIAKGSKKFMIDFILKDSPDQICPVQFPPFLYIKNDKKTYINSLKRHFYNDAINYLHEITIYLNNKIEKADTIYSDLYKQFMFLYNDSTNTEFDINKLTILINELKQFAIMKINIAGGDIFKYKKLEFIINEFNRFPCIKNYIVLHSEIINNKDLINKISKENSILTICADKEFTDSTANEIITILDEINIESHFLFPVSSKKEYEKWIVLINIYHINKFEFVPFYNNKNHLFFKNYIYIKKRRILNNTHTFKVLFSNSVINRIYFGKLFIFPDLSIKSNINSKSIGTYDKKTIMDCIYKELTTNNSWMKTRNKVETCKDCLYKFYCPPISNYEYVLKKNNLCKN